MSPWLVGRGGGAVDVVVCKGVVVFVVFVVVEGDGGGGGGGPVVVQPCIGSHAMSPWLVGKGRLSCYSVGPTFLGICK